MVQLHRFYCFKMRQKKTDNKILIKQGKRLFHYRNILFPVFSRAPILTINV
jgi:hypothetical protein